MHVNSSSDWTKFTRFFSKLYECPKLIMIVRSLQAPFQDRSNSKAPDCERSSDSSCTAHDQRDQVGEEVLLKFFQFIKKPDHIHEINEGFITSIEIILYSNFSYRTLTLFFFFWCCYIDNYFLLEAFKLVCKQWCKWQDSLFVVNAGWWYCVKIVLIGWRYTELLLLLGQLGWKLFRVTPSWIIKNARKMNVIPMK